MFTRTLADGATELFFEATGTGKEVRFAVGSEQGPRSSVWNVNVSGKGEIYIGERLTMSTLKISLHRSGIRRLAFEEKYAAAKLPKDLDRKITEWDAVELAPGWTHELDIWVPSDQVNTTAAIKSRRRRSIRRIVWRDKPAEGKAVVFHFLTCQMLHPEYRKLQFKQHGAMDIAALWLNRETGPEALVILICRGQVGGWPPSVSAIAEQRHRRG